MTTTTTSALAGVARIAWERLLIDAPVHEVLDWLREESGCEDVGACKRALYEAAGEWIKANPHPSPPEPPVAFLLGGGDLKQVGDWLVGYGTSTEWRDYGGGPGLDRSGHFEEIAKWCDRADLALSICRRIQELPE